jgi:uncharacterized protein YndB with AHSA1/START domain
MPRVTGELVIERPVEEVFEFVADERNEPRFNPRMLQVEKITSGPIGPGTRFSAEMATMRGSAPMMIEFIAFEQPHRLVSTTHLSSMNIRGSLEFDRVPQGTRLRWEWELEPRGVLRLTGPLIGYMGRRQEHAIWTNLKRLLEADSATTPLVHS